MLIKIAGAGISGLVAGLTLQKGGEQVELYEKASFVGSRPLEVKALRNYDSEVDVLDFLEKYGVHLKPNKRISKVIKYSPSLYKTEVFSKRKPAFYMIKCGSEEDSFNNQLLNEFLDEGGQIKFNSSLKESEADIIATGSKEAHALIVGGVYENLNYTGALHLFYNNQYFHKGYLTIMPHKDGLSTILLVSFFPKDINLKDRLISSFNKIKPLKEIVSGAKQIYSIGGRVNFDIPSSLIRNGKLIVGERGGLCDFSRAFGLKYAIVSGNLAGKSILNGQDYNAAWKEVLYEDLVDGFKNRMKFHGYTNEDLDKYQKEMGQEIFLDHYAKKRKPNVSDEFLYPLYRLKWSLFKKF